MRARLIAGLLAGLLLPATQLLYPGCATMWDGPTQGMRIRSKPTGARVFVDGNDRGLTPTNLKLCRWVGHRVRIELPGYEPYEVPLTRTGNSNVQGNLFIGVAPIFVDVLSGAVFTLKLPAEERKRMARLPRDPADNDVQGLFGDALWINAVLRPDPAWQKVGQLKRR